SVASRTDLLRRGLGEVKITHIGDIVKSGRKIIDKNGREKKFSPSGYQHFASSGSAYREPVKL
ncbi:MAG: hypothetical protein L6246_03275, partial [Thermodesulfovibrionales bacterium]|nr:hypothetical protein [Thermodesulfovibrionales bacterium]